jgi:hypothetical protein
MDREKEGKGSIIIRNKADRIGQEAAWMDPDNHDQKKLLDGFYEAYQDILASEQYDAAKNDPDYREK